MLQVELLVIRLVDCVLNLALFFVDVLDLLGFVVKLLLEAVDPGLELFDLGLAQGLLYLVTDLA